MIGCAMLLAVYLSACQTVPADDWALVTAVHYDPMNRGSSTGTEMTLPVNPYHKGALWVLAHELAHVKQRQQPAFWAEAPTLGPCTPYAESFTDPVEYAAENQAEHYAARLTGMGCR